MKKLNLEYKDVIKQYIALQELKQSELNFTNLFAWQEKYDFHVFEYKNSFVIVNFAASGVYFSQPLGTSDMDDLVKKLKETFEIEEVIFKKVSSDFIDQAVKADIKEVRDDFDYLYDFEALKQLKGNKYHKKKNHVNKFKSLYTWEYKNITQESISEIREFCKVWFEGKSDDLQSEYHAIQKVLDNYDQLDCSGGLIMVDGQVIAFTIGEVIDDTLLIHFEKANTKFNGAYTMIMQQYLLQFDDIKWINREQDLGIEGLRKSKLSYHPIDFVKKYTLTFN